VNKVKGKGFPYPLPSIGPGADPGVQAVSLQMTICHSPGGWLPLLSARPAVTFPAAVHQRPEYELNPRPVDRKSNALQVAPPHHHKVNKDEYI